MSDSTDADAVPSPVAELRGVTRRFGVVAAVRDVDLVLEGGGITALLGRNGAGKTTCVRLLLGLIAPTAGTIRLRGRDPRNASARHGIGAMLQVSRVPDTLRVAEHIDTFRSYFRRPLSRTALLRMAGIEHLERRLFGTLSGGERQRVLFALALTGDPELLVLDEPTAGMDVESRRALWRSIRAMRDDGRAVLLTTHHIEEADTLADRVVVLDRGRIAADGTPAQIRQRVGRRRVRCVTSLPASAVRELSHVERVEKDGAALVVTTGAAEHVVRALLAADATLSDLTITGAALEDAFLAVTTPGSAATSEVAA